MPLASWRYEVLKAWSDSSCWPWRWCWRDSRRVFGHGRPRLRWCPGQRQGPTRALHTGWPGPVAKCVVVGSSPWRGLHHHHHHRLSPVVSQCFWWWRCPPSRRLTKIHPPGPSPRRCRSSYTPLERVQPTPWQWAAPCVVTYWTRKTKYFLLLESELSIFWDGQYSEVRHGERQM